MACVSISKKKPACRLVSWSLPCKLFGQVSRASLSLACVSGLSPMLRCQNACRLFLGLHITQVSWAPPQVNSQPSCATVTQLTHRLVFPQVSQLPPSLASQLAFRPVPWTLRLPECRKVSRPPTMFACQLAFRAVQRRRHQPTCCQVFFHSPVL